MAITTAIVTKGCRSIHGAMSVVVDWGLLSGRGGLGVGLLFAFKPDFMPVLRPLPPMDAITEDPVAFRPAVIVIVGVVVT